MISVERLTTTSWQCIHFVGNDEIVGALREQLSNAGIASFDVDASTLSTKEELLSAIAKAMEFPDYFGMNWDALEECLRDMEWLPSQGYVLFMSNSEQFWRECPRLAGTLVEIWLSCAEDWSKCGVPFHLVSIW